MSVKEKAVLVTGATSGLGRATAIEFARQGSLVVATGRRSELGEELEAEVRGAGGELVFCTADVRKIDDCAKAVEATVAAYGRIDILINNAGIESRVCDFHELMPEDWDFVMEVNVRGAAFMARYAIPHFLDAGGGVILNISSVNAEIGFAHVAPYNTSKAALLQLTKTLAVEYLLQDIRVNAVVLGATDGGTASRSMDGYARYMRGPDYVREEEERTGMAKVLFQDGSEVAGVFAALCADEMRLLTGATIALDRTMTAGFTTSMTAHLTYAER